MKRAFVLAAVLLLTLCGLSSRGWGAEKAAPTSVYRITMLNSAGVQGAEDLTPFLTAQVFASLSDTTSSDTMITSSAVWSGKPLWRVTKDYESRIDIEGPVTLTAITMAPFHREGMSYKISYHMSTRLDDGEPQVLGLATRRANPMYTTRVPGWSFGIVAAYNVEIPPGKHSVRFKVAEGPFDFVYMLFQVPYPPNDIPEDEQKPKK